MARIDAGKGLPMACRLREFSSWYCLQAEFWQLITPPMLYVQHQAVDYNWALQTWNSIVSQALSALQ